MKTILTIFLLTVSVISAQAVVRIVDNNGNRPGGSNIYATFALAHTAADPGDTLLIIPSTNSYGNVNISESITVLGVGFNPEKNSLIKSSFGLITISNGTSNVNLSGLVANEISVGASNATYTMSNIIIEKCQIGRLATAGTTAPTLSSIIVRQNLFLFSGNNAIAVTFNANSQTNIVIANNIFSTTFGSSTYGIYTGTGGLLIDQNLFMGSGATTQYGIYQAQNSIISNNIFYGRNPVPALASTGATFNNNISFGNGSNNAFPVGGGYTLNNNQEVDPQFESAALGTYDFSKDVRLKAGSPALTAGPSSTEIGIYGGETPYKNSGVSVPVVKTLTLPTAIKEGTNTSATISVNGN